MDVVFLLPQLWKKSHRCSRLSFKELFKSGMNVGKDVMGTCQYPNFWPIPASIPLLLLMMAYEQPL